MEQGLLVNESEIEFVDRGRQLAESTEWNWYVKGIDSDYLQGVMAILAENQKRFGGDPEERKQYLRQKQNLQEATMSSNIYGVNQLLLPLIRRVYPYLMANNWVAIQPMLSPLSLIFYMRYYYTHSKSNVNAGQEFLSVPLQGDYGTEPFYSSQRNVVSATTASAVETAVNNTAADSKGFVNYLPLNASVFVRAYTSGETLLSEVHFQGSYGSATIAATPLRGQVANALNGASFNSATNNLSSVPTVPTAVKYEVEWMYNLETAGNNANGNGIPELEMRIKTDPVQAEERKIKTKWTIESSEDLQVMHQVDAEKELVALMAGHMLAEIDRQILKSLIDSAAHRVVHNFINDSGNNTLGNVIDRNQSLVMKVGYISSRIHKTTRVAPANFVVTSPVIAQRFEETRGYVPVEVGDTISTTYGIQAAGYLPGGKVRVFKDPLFPDDLILVGYKGKTFLDSGFFYCPYVPVKTTPVVYDPESLQPRRGMVSRYGMKMVDGGEWFYGTIRVDNILGNAA